MFRRFVGLDERIIGAAAARRFFCEDPSLNKIVDVPERGVLRALGKLRPFGRGEMTRKTIEQPVDHGALAAIEGLAGVYLPKARLFENGCEYGLGAAKSAIEAIKKPFQPWGDVKIGLLRSFKDIIVRVSLLPDLGRHAVVALRTILRAGERHIGNRTGDAAIPVIERVDGDEP